MADGSLPRAPYRAPWPVPLAPSAPLPAFRRRSVRLGLVGATVLGSFLAHGSLLAALALDHDQSTETPPVHARETTTGALYLQPEFLSLPHVCAWPPSPAVAACFDVDTLKQLPFQLDGFTYYGEQAASTQSWANVLSPYPEDEPRDLALAAHYVAVHECAEIAERAGWGGGGRVFVRVTMDKDGAALTQVLPLDEAANHAGLLCCLRLSQGHVAGAMRPGTTIRYVLTNPPGQGVTLTPNPL